MSGQRSWSDKGAIVIAASATAWVVGATLFYRSGGINPAGVIPTIGCLVAVAGAVRSDHRLMWLGMALVVVSVLAFVFSVGLFVAPAAAGLVVGSLVLSRANHAAGS